MTPYYQDEWVTLYHGDMREILPQLELVATVVTDPPYGIGLPYGEHGDTWRPDRETWEQIYRLLPSDGGSLHMTVSNKHLPFWLEEVQAAMFRYVHCSVYWNDTRAGGNWNGQFAYAWEPILHFTKGVGFRLGKRMLTDIFKHDGRRDTQHPAERNLGAWTNLVSLMPPGIILDPFAGSGTTLRACKSLGRKAIGIEREKAWCEQIANRCAQDNLFTLDAA